MDDVVGTLDFVMRRRGDRRRARHDRRDLCAEAGRAAADARGTAREALHRVDLDRRVGARSGARRSDRDRLDLVRTGRDRPAERRTRVALTRRARRRRPLAADVDPIRRRRPRDAVPQARPSTSPSTGSTTGTDGKALTRGVVLFVLIVVDSSAGVVSTSPRPRRPRRRLPTSWRRRQDRATRRPRDRRRRRSGRRSAP